MKKLSSILLPLILSLNLQAANFPSLTKENHPRLVITDKELAEIRTQIESGTNEPLELIHKSILSKADTLIRKAPLTYKKDASGKRILGVSRNAAQTISYCAYAYRYTGQKKYLDKAIETIRTVCGFKDWNPRHYLDVCEMVSGVAIGYDWLYSKLPDDVRRLIEGKVKEYAFDTMDGGHENIWTLMNNRNQVNLAGLTCAAIGLYEVYPDFADNLFRRVAESNLEVAKYIYNPDGAYPEGPGYWSYGTNYQVWLNMLMKENLGSNCGLDDIPGFRKTPWFETFAWGSTGYQFNYCDCRQESNAHYPLWYFADLLGDPSLLYQEIAYLKEHDYTNCQQRALIFIALKYASKINAADIRQSDKKLYVGDGPTPVAIARNGWGPNDHWAAMKGGKANSSHSHMDAGEFLYDSYGVRWSKDVYFYGYDVMEKPLKKLGGNYWSFDQESLRWQVSRVNCRWHSCLMIDDKDLLVDGFAKMTSCFEQADRYGATFDLTELYEKLPHAERSFAIVDNGYLEITDKIQTGSKARTMRFNLVSEGEPSIVDDGILLKRNGITMKVQTNVKGVKYQIWNADPADFNVFPFEKPAPDTYICGFTAKLPKKATTTFITTIKRQVETDPVAVGNKIAEQFLTSVPENYAPKGFYGRKPYGNGVFVNYSVTSLWIHSLEFARKTGNKELERRLIEKFEPYYGEKRHICNPDNHVDDSIFGALPLEIYLLNGDKRAYEMGMHYADHQFEKPDPNSLGGAGNFDYETQLQYFNDGYTPQTRLWIDDMYMINVLQTQAYRVKKDISYINRAAREMVLYLDKLQLADGLFNHAPDAPHKWGRGCGWMAAGMPMILKYLPKDSPYYGRIMESYLLMMDTLLKNQHESGLWGQLVDISGAWDETSCSAMFTYSFLEGINQGWLDKTAYGNAADKAWKALCDKLDGYANIADVCIGTYRLDDQAYYLARPKCNGDPHGQASMMWIINALLGK